MNRLQLIKRGLFFYRRTHIGVLVGSALSTAVLVGALLVGDSVDYSLRVQALKRLGAISHAMNSGNRFIGVDIADAMQKASDDLTVPALGLRGMMFSSKAERSQVNNVTVLGIDKRFPGLFDGTMPVAEEGHVVLSAKLAEALSVVAGDEVTLRISKPSMLSGEAPLSSRSEKRTSRKVLKVQTVVSGSQGGRFGLAANQAAPYNAFVNLEWLQKEAGVDGKANMLLSEAGTPNDLINKVGNIEQLGLQLDDHVSGKVVQLSCNRVFFDSASIGYENLRKSSSCAGVLTYLADSITLMGHPGQVTPYSFMSAIEPSVGGTMGIVPEDMKDDEIIINRWLADNLSAEVKSYVTVKYSLFKASNVFEKRSRTFLVRDILEMDAVAGEKKMLPAFPGLSGVENCADWSIGMPVNETALKDKANEEYWDKYGETPKAFVTLKAGQEMWGGVFGDLTAVRFIGTDKDKVRNLLGNYVSAASQGFFFVPVRAQALEAVDKAMDLGELFLGMSFFLIVAGMMLTGLLFAFGIQQRAAELGTLRAVGWKRGAAGRLVFGEGLLVAVCGAFPGMLLGGLYTFLLIAGLSGGWGDAVGGADIVFYYDRATLYEGGVAGVLCALLSMWFSVRWLGKKSVTALLTKEIHPSGFDGAADRAGEKVWKAFVGIGIFVAFCVVFGAVAGAEGYAVHAFFVAGLLLFSSGIGICRIILGRLVGSSSAEGLSVKSIGERNAARRCGRSLTVIGLVACGTFLVLAVSSMKEDMSAHADKRWSGTGGFELYGETAFPVLEDLGSNEGRKEFRLNEDLPLDVDIMMIKLRDGDDAGCRNLNRAQSPRLLGVNSKRFRELGAFLREEGDDLWALLENEYEDGVVPALVGDSDTAMWGLEKKTGPEGGETLDYRDESGREFKIKLVGQLPMRLSLFQGSLLISIEDFNRLFPSEAGYRVFLADVPERSVEETAKVLTVGLERTGADITGSVQRLEEFYSVETAYLSMFLVLGGLGLLLGSAGMGVVVMRNVLERRSELAMLRAVGYSQEDVSRVVISEHTLLLNMGLITGALASALAMWPSLASPAVKVPYGILALVFIGMWGLGTMWIHIAVRAALAGDITKGLRGE